MNREELAHDLLKLNSSKLLDATKQFDRYMVYSFLYFAFVLIDFIGRLVLNTDTNGILSTFLPEYILSVNRDSLEYIVPIIMIFVIFKIGLTALKMLELFVERDILIYDLIQFPKTDEAEAFHKMSRLKGAYRVESIGGIYYRAAVYKGLNLPELQDEINHRLRRLVLHFIHAIFVVNLISFCYYSIIKFDNELKFPVAIFSIVLLLLVFIIIGFILIDFRPRVKRLRKRINVAHDKFNKEYIRAKNKADKLKNKNG